MSLPAPQPLARDSQPTVGVVILTMGERPSELAQALASVLQQRNVTLSIAVVGNGWAPAGLPAGVTAVPLAQNVGIPAGRNAGVPHVTGDFLFFLDDDAMGAEPRADKLVLRRQAGLQSTNSLTLEPAQCGLNRDGFAIPIHLNLNF
jgi:hypothetical protein